MVISQGCAATGPRILGTGQRALRALPVGFLFLRCPFRGRDGGQVMKVFPDQVVPSTTEVSRITHALCTRGLQECGSRWMRKACSALRVSVGRLRRRGTF